MDESKVREAFEMFDKDKSGKLTGLEIVKVLRQMLIDQGCEDDSRAADMAVSILAQCDKNDDSEITFEEFLEAYKKEGQ